MLEWKELDSRHRIVDLKGCNDKAAYQLQWNFFDAAYFLIVEIGYNQTDMQEVIPMLNKKLSDRMDTLMTLGKVPDEDCKCFLVKKSKFLSANNKFLVQPSDLQKGSVRFMVFACEEYDNTLMVYYPEAVYECSVYKKITVSIDIKEKKGLFGLGAHVFQLSIPYIEGYQDYGLCYRISNLPYFYPITRQMMKKTLEITVPKSENVEVKVSPQGKERYQLR